MKKEHMNRTPTIFLRIVVLLMGLAVLALCGIVLPLGIRAEWGTDLIPILFAMYAAAIPFYVALYHTFTLLNLIDENNAFSTKSVGALRVIMYCAAAASAVFTAVLPYFYVLAKYYLDAPGLMVIGTLLAGGPLVIAVFAAVLRKLVQSAIAIKAENDLTV